MAVTEDVDPQSLSVAFGWRLREVREARGFSQEGLAGRAGMRPNAVGRLERGSREPRISTVLRVARGLDVQPGVLLDNLLAEEPVSDDGEGPRGGVV